MKSKFSYKSKRTIIIAAIITVLLAGTVTGVYFFTKGNTQAQAAEDGNTAIQEEQYGEAPIENQSGEQTATPSNNEQGEINQEQTEGQQGNQEQTTNTQPTQNNQTTTTTTTGEVPNQEYVTEREETIINPWETLTVGWGQMQLGVITSTAELNANKPNLEINKIADKTDVKTGETITYTIIAKNNSKKTVNAIIYDNVPTGAVLLDENGTEDTQTKKLSWKVKVEAGKTAEVAFTVKVTSSSDSIRNTAVVNGKQTNATETKIANITTTKSSVGIRNGQQLAEGAPLHEFDVIEYTLTATNSGNGKGSVVITDEVPAGTTLVEDSIKLDGKGSYSESDLNNGIDVELEANTSKAITFKVTVNKLNSAEVHIKNQVATQDGETITPGTDNKVEKEYVTVTANKEFDDNNNEDKLRPTSVELELYADGVATGKKATAQDGSWSVEFTQLDKYTENGSLIKYTVQENNVDVNYTPSYQVQVNGDNTTVKVVNTLKYENVKIPVVATKEWVDNNNQAGVRPDSVEFELYADGVATNQKLSVNKVDGNLWTVTFEDVDKYKSNGDKITYTVKEVNTPEHYTKVENGLKVTNTIDFTTITTIKEATKVWDDANNANRPTEVEIGIYNGENKVKTAKANAANSWTATFDDVQRYTVDGKEIEYAFREVTIPDGYVTTVEDNTITNALPRLEVTKTVKSINNIDATSVDNSVVKAGDVIGYQIKVENTGSVTVKDIQVAESLNVYLDKNSPNETTKSVSTISELKAGEHREFTVYYTVTDEDVANVNEDLVNSATATGKYTDGNNNEKEVGAEGEVSVSPEERNALSIVKSQTVNGEEVTADTKVVPGDEIDYTITVKNTGNTVLNNVNVTDSMTGKEGFTVTDGSLNIGTLGIAPNNVKIITATYTVQESDMSVTVGKIINTATVKADKVSEIPSEVEVPTEAWYADISTVKTSEGSATPLHELDTITYNLTATNNGNDDGSVVLADTVPEGTTLVANSIKVDGVTYTETQLNSGITVHLNAGETKVLTFKVTINPFETETRNIVNNAATQDGTQIPGTSDEVEKEYISVTVNKIWDDNSNEAGKRPEKITLTLNKIDVNGNTVKVKDVELTGDLTAKQWTATENVQKYDEKANEIHYFVVEDSTGSIFYTNTDADTTDLTTTNKFVVPDDKSDITIRKVWNDNNNASKRTSVTFAITGNGATTNATLTSADAKVNNGNIWEKKVTTLPKYDELGNEITYTFDEVNVPAGYIKTLNGSEITNSLPGIKVTKTVEKVNNVKQEGIDQIVVNKDDVIEYQITVENIGTAELTNVKLTDNLNVYSDENNPNSTTNTLIDNGTLSVEETKTFTVYYKVTAEDVREAKQILTNTATATGEYKDSNKKVQTVTDTDSADVIIADAPGIEIVKTQKVNGNTVSNDTKVKPGDVITYTITVTNTGNTVLNNVNVTDSMTGKEGFTVANGSLNIGTLGIAPNNVRTITATYTVQESDMKETESAIENTATVSTSTTPDGSSTVTVTTEEWKSIINVEKHSEIIKQNPDSKVTGAEYGDTIKYTITATNSGNKPDIVVVKDKAPNGTTAVESDIYTALSSEEGYTLAVPAKDTASVSFDVTVTSKPTSTITNTAIVDGKEVKDPEEHKVEKEVSVKMDTQTPKINNSNVVIVLDVSGSMDKKPDNTDTDEETETRLYAAKQACNNLIDGMFKDGEGCKVSVVTFSSKSGFFGNYDNAKTIGTATNSIEADSLKTTINGLSAYGGTRIAAGINEANTEINKLAKGNDNQNIVIVLSDGDFTIDEYGYIQNSGGETKARVETASASLKNSACKPTVYAVAFASNESSLMEDTIASELQDGTKAFKTASDYTTLLDIFSQIGSEIGEGNEQHVATTNGLLPLPGLDVNKDITIRLNGETTGTTGKVSEFGDKIVLKDGVYYLDTTKYDADAEIEIEYVEVQLKN